MKSPQLVAEYIAAMKSVVDVPITVKCRLGVDDQDTVTALDDLVDCCVSEGMDAIWVHARKAWLDGLSPKENRDIPPLDYERVYDIDVCVPVGRIHAQDLTISSCPWRTMKQPNHMTGYLMEAPP